jgi:hypothetical protein
MDVTASKDQVSMRRDNNTHRFGEIRSSRPRPSEKDVHFSGVSSD